MPYDQALRSSLTVMPYDHALRSSITIMPYGHALRSSLTIKSYDHDLRSCLTIKTYDQALPPCSPESPSRTDFNQGAPSMIALNDHPQQDRAHKLIARAKVIARKNREWNKRWLCARRSHGLSRASWPEGRSHKKMSMQEDDRAKGKQVRWSFMRSDKWASLDECIVVKGFKSGNHIICWLQWVTAFTPARMSLLLGLLREHRA